MKPYLEKRFEVVSDRADLYAYFFERGLKLLKEGGRMGFISSSTFFKTGAGKPLREFLLRKATLETIVDFGDLQVFEGVTTYPAILTMQLGAAPKNHELQFWNVAELPASNFRATFRALAGPYPQTALTAGSWELESPALRELRAKIREGKQTLKEVYGSPFAGIKTGYNPAFILTNAQYKKLLLGDPNSATLLKPILFGTELQQWKAEQPKKWILYIPKTGIDISNYPAIESWLLTHKPKLEKRAAKQNWFELQQPQQKYQSTYEGVKLIYRDIANKPSFSVDDGNYIDMTCFCIPEASHFEAALLSSNTLWFSLISETTVAQGGYYRMKSQYIKLLPIPAVTTSQKAALATLAETCQTHAEARYALQEGLRRRIPDLCPSDRNAKLNTKLKKWWLLPDFAAFRAEIKKCFKAEIPLNERTDWEDWITRDKAEIRRLSGEIAKLEAEINKQVYALFDLTVEEVSLLEANI